MAAFCVQDQAGLDPETVRAWGFLDSQGTHFVLVNRDKVPIHRRWQLPWERPSLGQALRHLAGGGLVGHVPAAVGTVVLDLDESDDGGRQFMDRHPPYWDIPSRRAGGLHLYYNSRVQYGNRDWRMGSAAGQLRSRNGFVVIWDPHDLAEMLACRAMFEVSPEDELFPAAAVGARPQPPRDWGQRKPPPRREPAERRRRSSQPHQPPLPGIDAPRRPQRPEEPQEASRPAEWALREPPGRLRAARAPKGDAPGERNVRLFDAVRHFAYPLPRGRGGPAMYAQWGRFLQDYAAACNGEFAVPLSDGDVAKTARSVARFTWTNPSFGKPGDPGRRDRDVQRRRSRLGVLARQRRVVERNRVIRAMRDGGLGVRAIGRELALSASQVSRVLHNPITPSVVGDRLGSVKFVESEDYEIRNGCAADLRDETSQEQPANQSETARPADNPDETRSHSLAEPSEAVPAWVRRVARESGLTVEEVLQLARDARGTGWRIRLSAAGLDRVQRRERGPPW